LDVSCALYKYGASVKNAKESCQKLNEEIKMINNIASAAEELVRNLPTMTAPDIFCQYWTDDQSPAMSYKKTLNELMKALSPGCGMKALKRLTWPLIEPQIKDAIESFERYIPYLELSLVLSNT
jgi:hypothetical protein